MVEFCTACGTSLPKGDLTIREGKLYTSHDYTCPNCRQPANPTPDEPVEADLSADQEVVFRHGNREIQ